MAAPLSKMRRLLLPLLLASTTAAKSTYWKEVEAKKEAAGGRGLLSKKVLQDGNERRRAARGRRFDMLLVGAGDDFRAGRVRRGDDGDGGARLFVGFRLRPRQGDAAGGRQ